MDTPANEEGRLQALLQYSVLDTPPEIHYDEIAELAAQICGCPTALISFIDETRQWMKAKYGFAAPVSECPREITVCTTTICNNDILYVPDLTRDERFNKSPLVSGELSLRFYCGMPIINPEGYALGTICVVDFEPRELSFEQREGLRRLSRQVVAQLELRRKLIERDALLRDLVAMKEKTEHEKANAERLLLNILPASVADELKSSDRVRPQFFDSVTVMFVDFCNFTRLVESLEPATLVHDLHQHFSVFDDIVAQYRMEKLKTIGDAYMAVGGLPEPNRTHAVDVVLAALQIQHYLGNMNRQREKLRLAPWEARIGINTGPVIAGVVGRSKFTYDIWGNTVNVAERMEATGEVGSVNVSEATWDHIMRRFQTEERGPVEIKGKGKMNAYRVSRLKPEFSADPLGLCPNQQFSAASR